MVVVIILLTLVIILVFVIGKTPVTIKAHWQTFLDGFQVPAQDFYGAVTTGLAARQITKVSLAEESFLERHILSAKRVYLRITQNEYMYYICAAPYGTGTFISSWLCVKDEQLTNKIPVLSKLAGKDRGNKTFYQMDTEAMFRLAVHATVLEAVNGMTEAKGLRGLSELERQLTPYA